MLQLHDATFSEQRCDFLLSCNRQALRKHCTGRGELRLIAECVDTPQARREVFRALRAKLGARTNDRRSRHGASRAFSSPTVSIGARGASLASIHSTAVDHTPNTLEQYTMHCGPPQARFARGWCAARFARRPRVRERPTMQIARSRRV